MNHQISASLLSADFARLGEDAQAVLDAGADSLHFDAMDNHFVPNLTMGPMICAALRTYGIKADISVHLMVKPIDRLIVDFAKAGATRIIFHPEASENVERDLSLVQEHGCKAGLSLKPETTLQCLEGMLTQIDTILVMSVHPGFAGQTFIPSSLEKIRAVKNLISQSGKNIFIGVDGGIHIKNIAQVAQAGANVFVSGSAIFNQPVYASVINDMRNELLLISQNR